MCMPFVQYLQCHVYMCGVGCFNLSIWFSVLSHVVEYHRSIVCSSEQLCDSFKRCSLLCGLCDATVLVFYINLRGDK